MKTTLMFELQPLNDVVTGIVEKIVKWIKNFMFIKFNSWIPRIGNYASYLVFKLMLKLIS